MMTLYPYKEHSESNTWVFDDAEHGLTAEPFVGNNNVMIDRLLASKEIPSDGMRGRFKLNFAAKPFAGYDVHLHWVGGDRTNLQGSGNVYSSDQHDLEGWLCPALFCYFKTAPDDMYVMASAVEATGQL